MSDASLDRSNLAAKSSGDQRILHHTIFGVLFLFSLMSVAFSRLTDDGASQSVWSEAKQAAHAAAGYAVKY